MDTNNATMKTCSHPTLPGDGGLIPTISSINGGNVKHLSMIRADLSPIFANPNGESLDDSQIEDWEGCVMFEGTGSEDHMEQIAQTTVSTWAEISEWSVEIICTGLYRLTPREWITKRVTC